MLQKTRIKTSQSTSSTQKTCHTYLDSDILKKRWRNKSNLTQLCVQDAPHTVMWMLPSLQHAADNELVLPTHGISPHQLHRSPVFLPRGLRFLHFLCFLCGASGGEERLGGLRGRRRGYRSFRREINKPPAAHPQQWSQCELFSGWWLGFLMDYMLKGSHF